MGACVRARADGRARRLVGRRARLGAFTHAGVHPCRRHTGARSHVTYTVAGGANNNKKQTLEAAARSGAQLHSFRSV